MLRCYVNLCVIRNSSGGFFLSRVIAIVNQKGGVGKTTTAINLGASLGAVEKKTLLIDIDPQCNASSGLGFSPNQGENTIYSALLNMSPLDRFCVQTEIRYLNLIPSDRGLVGLEVELLNTDDREMRLKTLLSSLRSSYEYILIDCPPSLGLLTLNALAACDSVLIPIQCEYFALEGVSDLISTIKKIKTHLNNSLFIEGILLTMYDERTNLSRQVVSEIRSYFGDVVYKTVVPRNVRLGEAPSFGKPVITYDIKSKGAQAYLKLAKEVIGNGKKGAGKGA